MILSNSEEEVPLRISELSATTEVPVATIKYYLREHLLPEGARASATQANYDDRHVQRVRVIRALVDSGVSIAATRKVIAALNDPPSDLIDLLGAAHAAITPEMDQDIDLTEAEQLLERLGGAPGSCDPRVLASVARSLRVARNAGYEVPADVMTTYLDSIRAMADAEVAAIPTESAEAAVVHVVLGTALVEPLILALRRVAEQVASEERFQAR